MTRRPSDDLFEDTRMSFGEHLEELRKTLVRCLIFIGIGCGVGFLVAENVVNFLQAPLVKAIKEYNDGASLKKYTDQLGFYPPEISNLLKNGLAPETVQIDPAQIVKAIRSISPDALGEVDLTKPYLFLPKWIEPENVTAIVSGLTLQEDSNVERQGQLKALASMMSPADRDELSELSNDESSRNRLTLILNRLIETPKLNHHDSFMAMMSEPAWSWKHLLVPASDNQLEKMKKQVDKHPEDLDLARRLNRLLVAGVFPDQIAPPKIELVNLEIWRNISEGTQALSPHEVFMVWVKAAIVTGLVLSGPFVFFQLWMFVAVGLYPHEQKYVYYYLPISILLFVAGVCLAFFFVFDPVLKFLFSFNASMGISPQLRIGEWLSFVMFLPLGFGIAFQLPLVMLFTNRVGLVSVEVYIKNWRLAVLVISVLSMLLTPADPISMVMLGGPLTVLYFFGIMLCKWMPRPENPFGDEAITPVS